VRRGNRWRKHALLGTGSPWLRKGEAYRDPLEDRAQQDPVTELA
jgi:hypothetical protein